MSVISVQSVKMVTAIVLLSVFLVSGALADCPEESALFITAPKQMEALIGSCLQIPCNFSRNITAKETFDGTRPTFGMWIKSSKDFAKNPNNVIFNSSGMDNIYPMNLTGDLSQKNCTTLFSSLITSYTDEYFFRIENGPFRATASCNPLQITVIDSPPRPSIEISGDLKENQSVTITCSAFTPCPHFPPELTWTLQQNPHNKIEENTDGTFTTKIQKTFTLSDEHDGFIITCSARYPVNEGKDNKTAEERTTLSVSYAPKDTSVSISPSGLVSAGSLVNLTCSSRANPPVNFTWFKTSKDGPVSVSEGDFYSFKVTSVTDIEGYYCVATNDLGSQTSSRINNAESSVSSLQWGSALGGILVIILICLAICVWWFKSKRPQTQSQRGDELTLQMPTSKTEQDIHYGEIDFSKRRPEPSSASEQDSGQQQDTLYAQVNVSQTASSLRKAADVPEDLYAQVKKK
ncbi:B-cell receptor CD22-like [Sebastes umbrosus]|uniref:B-cell receptor CD22-like n=1 Tax=Sebastes umbrosus TaxID=72105 RepID=UPI00189CFAF6|nr:B-cell receptor CD22-like [Sebastes umbrosus]XP_037613394.1 B-cell receptor CD22-like [Sebastes umbrosus]